MRLRNEYLTLNAPESTPATTSGSSTPAPAEGVKDVGPDVTAEPVVDEQTDWAALGDDETPPNEAPTDETPGEGTPPPSEKPDEKPGQPKPGEEPPTPPPGQPGEKQLPGEKPGEQAPPQPQQPPQETEEQRVAREKAQQEAETKAFEDLKKYYAVPEEMAERLRTEPELVLPEMAARVHQAVIRANQQWAMQMLPQMFQQQQLINEANTKSKEAFFSRWPSLAKHEEQVLQIGRMFAQMNPKATPQERLEKVGQLACAALNITPDPKSGTPPPPKAPTKPGQPQTRSQPMRPSNPAGSSGAGTPPSANEFETLAEEFLQEDQG
jgi:hypothetical protein